MAQTEVEKLKKINTALMEQVERSMDQQGNAFSLFQTAIGLEKQVRLRTDELAMTLRRLEQSNRALKTAKNAAEQANISKTRFLAAASHDVLQPLNAASLSLSILTELQTTDQGQALAHQVEKSLSTMDELLKTLLDISKLDSGIMKPEIVDVSIDRLFDSLKSDMAPIAAQSGLEVRFRCSGLHARSDRMMLRRILQNIIGNAIRYTDKGGVVIGTRQRDTMVQIDIVDTGIGIPEDEIEAVFEEFYRGSQRHTSGRRFQGGLGLGLSIVQRMVSTLGHQLSVTSIPGRGSSFRLRVPVSQQSDIEQTGEVIQSRNGPLDRLIGANVLVVENDIPVINAMTALLGSWRCNVRSACGIEEIDAFLADTDWRPDIVLADLHLDNDVWGTDVVGEIRNHTRLDLPAVIITAGSSDDLAEKLSKTNIELMQKPVKPAELRALMAHLLAN
ncbi:MAG: ATP-binding protein [Stappiaceae bacterium]